VEKESQRMPKTITWRKFSSNFTTPAALHSGASRQLATQSKRSDHIYTRMQ
jgi:hypothetical protein